MSRAIREATKPITVGDCELCRWPDHALVEFRCPLQHQGLRFHHIEGSTRGIVEIELASAPQSAPVVAGEPVPPLGDGSISTVKFSEAL